MRCLNEISNLNQSRRDATKVLRMKNHDPAMKDSKRRARRVKNQTLSMKDEFAQMERGMLAFHKKMTGGWIDTAFNAIWEKLDPETLQQLDRTKRQAIRTRDVLGGIIDYFERYGQPDCNDSNHHVPDPDQSRCVQVHAASESHPVQVETKDVVFEDPFGFNDDLEPRTDLTEPSDKKEVE